jgi:hypothetical protein
VLICILIFIFALFLPVAFLLLALCMDRRVSHSTALELRALCR